MEEDIMNTPMAILLAGIVHPFWFRYIPAMKCSDIHTSKTDLSKVKALFFYAFIIAITCELLSDSAFLDIRPN